MPKLMPIEERNEMNRCWFCGTNKSVKYIGEIINPCPTAKNRFIEITMCNKCCALHMHHLAENWTEKKD